MSEVSGATQTHMDEQGRTLRKARPLLEPDECIRIYNENIILDELREKGISPYHLKLSPREIRLFSSVKTVLMGGSSFRMQRLAAELHRQLGLPIHCVQRPSLREAYRKEDLFMLKQWTKAQIAKRVGMPIPLNHPERYSIYMVGDIMLVNHCMGLGTVGILMHELILLLATVQAKRVEFIRVGTSGGIGLDPGTVVITTDAVPDIMRKELDGHFPLSVAGKEEYWEARADEDLIGALKLQAKSLDVRHQVGRTMAKSGFYLSEARLDGPTAPYTDEDVEAYHKYFQEIGVLNSEMEAGMMLAIANHFGLPAAVVCTVLDDCLQGQKIDFTPTQLKEFSRNAEQVVIAYLAQQRRRTVNAERASTQRRLMQSLFG